MGQFSGLRGLKVVADGSIERQSGQKVGVVVEGDMQRLVGKAVDENGNILNSTGNVIGRAVPLGHGSEPEPGSERKAIDSISKIWRPLHDDREIRLLHIEALPSGGEPLKTSLKPRNLDRYPRYNAISWAWGTPGPMSLITVDGHNLRIPTRLDTCLRHLSQILRERSFWVDAICVDQSNAAERAMQVEMMEHIFSTADTVYAWLGSEQSSYPWLPSGLVGSLESHPGVATNTNPLIRGFCTSRNVGAGLLADWWHRAWPVQEVLLARRLTLCFGTEMVDIETVRAVVTEVRLEMAQTTDLLWLVDFRSRVQVDPTRVPVEFTELLHKSRLKSTTDARDKVYGLLGVCNFLFGRSFLRVDYTKSLAKVYTELAWRFIESTRSLAILNQACSLHHSSTDIPSWVPDLSSRYDHQPERCRLPEWHLYRASSRLDNALADSRKYELHSDRILNCYGSIRWKISKVFSLCEWKQASQGYEPKHEVASYGITVLRWLEQYYWLVTRSSGGLLNGNLEYDYKERFAMTIFRGIDRRKGTERTFLGPDSAWDDFDSLIEPIWSVDNTVPAGGHLWDMVRHSTDDCLMRMFPDSRLTLNSECSRQSISSSERSRRSTLQTQMLDICYKNLAGQRFFVGQDCTQIGVGPADTQVGDEVAVLSGGNVPYVLRPWGPNNVREKKKPEVMHAVHIGECYLTDLMDAGKDRDFDIHDIYLH